jgi:hypothetical protein
VQIPVFAQFSGINGKNGTMGFVSDHRFLVSGINGKNGSIVFFFDHLLSRQCEWDGTCDPRWRTRTELQTKRCTDSVLIKDDAVTTNRHKVYKEFKKT